MTFFNYINNTPDAGEDPSVTQPDLLTNTQSNDQIWQIDHHGFNDNLGGYHTTIHQDARVGNPAAIPGPPAINQIYVKSVTPDSTGAGADTQLFSITGAGGVSQLTGNLATSEGYQWIGGLLIQWGTVTVLSGSGNSSHRTGTVTFKDRTAGSIPFPNNCFNVTGAMGVDATATTTASTTLYIRDFTRLQFRWVANTSSSFNTDFTNFYWWAIGN